MLMPLQVWKQLGGFDAGYFMFFEDVDLCWRARKRGYLCALVPSAQVVHLQGKSWKDQPKAMIIAHHRSAGRFMAKKYPHLWQAPLRLALRLALRARAWIVTRRRR